ncbi:MAG TPA: sigma 54-interacting transcriptional regulator, partial [Candidatus Kapabacteria bacterium]|nr:sigma 54-interacting transcriptional regulator [Candidatus Kapabacteria bacterium]
VEAANGGTLFLDEIGEIPPAMQAKLLRFLQSREFQRVGENETRFADVRIIAATNRNLEEAIKRNEFREDLFYRLSGVRLLIPPLRLRREDILPLAEAFVAGASKAPPPEISEAVRAAVLGYEWRGNVRELENTMLRAAILAGNRRTIELEDLSSHIGSRSADFVDFPASEDGMAALRSLEEVERDYIAQVIRRTTSLEEAARVLKIDSATLWRKRKKYSL